MPSGAPFPHSVAIPDTRLHLLLHDLEFARRLARALVGATAAAVLVVAALRLHRGRRPHGGWSTAAPQTFFTMLALDSTFLALFAGAPPLVPSLTVNVPITNDLGPGIDAVRLFVQPLHYDATFGFGMLTPACAVILLDGQY